MKRFFLTTLALFLIIALGAFIRFYQLGKAPAGLYIDEAGQGYSAYSILKTGKDEFGKEYPIVFRSFNDFKTPIYIYLVVPLIPIFGLSPFTVRLPSFIFSVLTFPLLYLLLFSLSKSYRLGIALLTTLLLAISPWHTLFGRTNFECNVALFFFILGLYLFYLGLKKPFFLIISTIFFAISLPAYHSERIITPITVGMLVWRYRKTIFSKANRFYLIIAALVGFIITLPTLSVALSPGFLARASGLNIFSHLRQYPAGFLENYQGVLAPLVNGSWFLSTKEFLSLYISYFSPRFMFNLGDYGPRSSFPDLATFFIWQFPFYILGLYLLFREKKLGELRFLTLWLFFITPIPAALTRDPYTTIRALPLVIPQLIIISFGIIKFLESLTVKFKILAFVGLAVLVIHSVLSLYSSGIVLNEYYRAKEWNWGLEQVADFTKTAENIPIIVDNSREEPYIQLLFFLKYDPLTYQKDNFEVPLSEYYTNLTREKQKRIGRIITSPVNWENDLLTDQFLIGDSLSISVQQIKEHQLFLVKEILYPDKSVAFRIVRTNPSFEKQVKAKAI